MALKRYTLVGIYNDNNQRYATDCYGSNATEAVIDAIENCRLDNGDPEKEITVCALFRGSHSSKDVTVTYAHEEPNFPRCRAKIPRKFTVVGARKIMHVMGLNAIDAELQLYGDIAGVFNGHQLDISAEVDQAVVEERTRIRA